MKRTLTFLIESPLDRRNYIRFGIQYLASRYVVQIIDCTHYVYPKIPAKLNAMIDPGCRYTLISSSKELRNIDPVGIGGIVIDMLGETISGNTVRRHLLQNGGLRVLVLAGRLHFTPSLFLERLKKLIIKAWRPTTIQSFLKQAVRVLDKKLAPVRPIDLLVLGGAADITAIRSTSIVYAHSFDYDRWQTLPQSNLVHQGKFALFLDEDMVSHPDYIRLRLQPAATEASYYSAINLFFNIYQKYTGIPVYVAMHPHSQYLKQSNLWGNRILFYEQTPEAIKAASQIFTHFSTSISFAILANKPITHLISDEIMKSFLGRQIIGLSKFLNTQIVNIDHELNEKVALSLGQIDMARYRAYKNRYIKSEDSEEAPLWEIIAKAAERKLIEASK